MEISSLFSPQALYANEISTRDEKKKQAELALTTASGDTVTISEEARIRAAQMIAEQKKEETKDELFNKKPSEDEETTHGAAKTEEESQGIPSGGSGSTADRIKKIETMIKQLNQQMVSIMNTSGDPDQKLQRTEPLKERIDSLQGELTELKQMLRQQDRAATTKSTTNA